MQFNQHLTAQWPFTCPYLAKAAYPPKPPREPRRCRGHDGPETMLVGMKKWLAWLIVGGPVVVYAIGKFLSR